jgi:hypothetical protein
MVQLRAFVRMGVLFLRACAMLGKGTKKGPFHAERAARANEGRMCGAAREARTRGEGALLAMSTEK